MLFGAPDRRKQAGKKPGTCSAFCFSATICRVAVVSGGWGWVGGGGGVGINITLRAGFQADLVGIDCMKIANLTLTKLASSGIW